MAIKGDSADPKNRTLMHNGVGGAVVGHDGPEVVGLGVVPMFRITGMVCGCLGPVAAPAAG